MRTFLDDLMAEAAGEKPGPAICRRIRRIRLAKKRQDARRFSQEAVAQRVGVTLKAYRAYEKFRVPNAKRLRAIEQALDLEDGYFERSDISEEVRQAVREELAEWLEEQTVRLDPQRFEELVERVERLLDALEGERRAEPPDG